MAAERAREELERQLRALCEAGRWEEATRRVLSRYGPEILGWLIGVVKEEDKAKDICQQFSIALWRGLPGFRWESSLRVWAYQIARRELIRFQRAGEHRQEYHLATSELSGLAQEITTLHSLIHRKQESDQLVALRQRLPEEAQTLLILRVDRELSFGEIARVLEIEEEAARQQFKRAKDRLKEMARREGLLS
jgi:RNA polymerase sigma-70 factor, ECF subfamily